MIVLGTRALTRRIPGPLIAVILAIGTSRFLNLNGHGAAVVGAVLRGLPTPWARPDNKLGTFAADYGASMGFGGQMY